MRHIYVWVIALSYLLNSATPADREAPAAFGFSVASLGDVDSDGWSDYCVGAPLVREGRGAAYLVSGKDLHVIYSRVGTVERGEYGTLAESLVTSAGPHPSTGIIGVILGGGNRDPGLLCLQKGRELQAAWSLELGSGESLTGPLAGGGDLDSDGVPDFAFARKGAGSATTECCVCSGNTGKTIRRISRAVDDYGVLRAICFVGDIDGDGIDDLAASFINGGPGKSISRIELVSGKDGKTIREVCAPKSAAAFGSSLCRLGDVNEDGIPDFAVGAPDISGDEGAESAVYIISGKDGGQLVVVREPGRAFGLSLVAIGDVDGDHISDIAVADSGAIGCRGAVYGFSSKTGRQLFNIRGTDEGQHLGSRICVGFGLPSQSAGLQDRSPVGKVILVASAPEMSDRQECVELYAIPEGKKIAGLSVQDLRPASK